jgi:hypothetical protein
MAFRRFRSFKWLVKWTSISRTTSNDKSSLVNALPWTIKVNLVFGPPDCVMLFDVGGIGHSYILTVQCQASSAGQLSFLPAAQALPSLSLPLTVQLCGTGTEQIGAFCKVCDLNYYSFDGKQCLSCPYGTKDHATQTIRCILHQDRQYFPCWFYRYHTCESTTPMHKLFLACARVRNAWM